MERITFDKSVAVIEFAARSKNALYTGCHGIIQKYDIVNEFPESYEVWNIGRNNFPFEGYVPLAEVKDFNINPATLKAIKCCDEETALLIINKAARRTVGKRMFNRLNQSSKSN